jgi:hypothetical protein
MKEHEYLGLTEAEYAAKLALEANKDLATETDADGKTVVYQPSVRAAQAEASRHAAIVKAATDEVEAVSLGLHGGSREGKMGDGPFRTAIDTTREKAIADAQAAADAEAAAQAAAEKAAADAVIFNAAVDAAVQKRLEDAAGA